MEPERKVYTVAEVNRKVRTVLESALGELWVEGELSRVTLHSSGHWYFTLKDEHAAVSCAMFRNDNQRVLFRPEDGLKVQILARASLYEVNGRYQLIASLMEEAGKGSLQEQFEKLKAKLAAEGLFDASRKKPLPRLPRKIGIVTSPTGAAIRDIIQVITRRFPGLEILLVPVKVQGAGAERGIARAIDYLNERGDIDLMIVGRGGGSIEDLWCFNEEMVARAIARSDVPVISAVGHEIDFTISDFAADVRAPTPSAAAELAVPVKVDLEDALVRQARQLRQSLMTRLQEFRLRCSRSAHSYVFREPSVLVNRYQLQVGSLRIRLKDLLNLSAKDRRQMLERVSSQMVHRMQTAVQQAQQHIDELGVVMLHQTDHRIARNRQTAAGLQSQLRMLNPLSVLGRGYSITRKSDGTVVRNAGSLEMDESMVTQFAEGKVVSIVKEKE